MQKRGLLRTAAVTALPYVLAAVTLNVFTDLCTAHAQRHPQLIVYMHPYHTSIISLSALASASMSAMPADGCAGRSTSSSDAAAVACVATYVGAAASGLSN
jgi:hypothetical protein